MNAIKIFYMAIHKANIAIYGVVSHIIFLGVLETKIPYRLYNQREGCPKRNFEDPTGNVKINRGRFNQL